MTTLQSLPFFKSELALIFGACLTLFSDLTGLGKKSSITMALLTIAVSTILALPFPDHPLTLFQGFYLVDGITFFFRFFILLITGTVILMSAGYLPLGVSLFSEYLSLLLFIAFGLMLMAGSAHILTLFLAVEFVSLLSYLLTGFSKKNLRSSEAALKYLLFGSFCSAIMLYGLSLLFGLSGSLEFSAVKQALLDPQNRQVGTAALFLVLTGLGFKISMAPFHFWAPDVYDGAPTPVAAFFTVAPKALGFALLIRVLIFVFAPLSSVWLPAFYGFAIITMTVGNLSAAAQTNMKRLLAYSSIAHAGYLLMGLAVFTERGLQAVFVYLIVYAISNLGLFTALMATAGPEGHDSFEAFSGLAKRSPFTAACFTVFLLSLAGIPPLAGFMGKFGLFAAVMDSGYIVLALTAGINSLIAAFYYLKIIRIMYFKSGFPGAPALRLSFSAKALLFVLFSSTVGLGIFPSLLFSLTSRLF